MKKWLALLKTFAFSLVIYMWFLGSSLLISIDEKSNSNTICIYNGAMELKMKNLTARISTLCQVQSKSQFKLQDHEIAKENFKEAKRKKAVRDNLIYIPELNQLWCLVPKAASTSWSMKILESLIVKDAKLQQDLRNASVPIQVILRKHYGNIGTKVYKDIIESEKVTKILLTRHPFSRLISAFEDKLKDRKAKNDSMFFFSHYGVKINRAFRKNKRQNKRKEPIFEEFVEYLLKTNPEDYDDHWKPISLLCGVCHVPYNHIIKQETLQNFQSMKFHLMKLNFDGDQGHNFQFQRKNKSHRQYENMMAYFRNISSEKMLQLYQKFEDDFNFFGYM